MQEREGQASVTHVDDHVIVRVWTMVHAAQRTHADESCGRAGAQKGMRCVLEARVVQRACIITIAGRLQQRREQMDGAVAASGPI